MLTMEMVLHKEVDFAPKFGKSQFYVETLFCPNPFKSPNYFLALHVPLWNRHNKRRLLRFVFDNLKS